MTSSVDSVDFIQAFRVFTLPDTVLGCYDRYDDFVIQPLLQLLDWV